MKKSEQINELAKALALFQSKIKNVSKDSKNPFFKSKYASLPAILDEIRLPLSECKLSVAQFPCGENELTTLLMHESGQYIEATYSMKPVKDDPQGRGSCLTYMRRYALQSVLNLGAEDDDANEATQPRSKEATPNQPKDEKSWLTEGQFKAMMAELDKHNWQIVEEKLPLYKVKKEWREELDAAIKFEKALSENTLTK